VSRDFIWRDADRVVLFRRDGVEGAPQLLDEHGFGLFDLLSTERALLDGPGLRDAASTVHLVADGQVPQAAAALLETARSTHLVAFGGGRVVDTSKAVAAISGAQVAAIPTTLSGAEMTGIHRLPAGAEERAGGLIRPHLVIADPEAMTSAPEQELRMSAMNALAHGADSFYTPYSNPISEWAALRGAGLIASSLDEVRDERDRGALAEGAILCGYAIDSALFSIHHVVCQTLVRVCGSPHAATNAAILPRAMAFMEPRAPDAIESLARAIESAPAEIEARILQLGGDPPGLGAAGADHDRLDEALEAMLQRPELDFNPQPPTKAELAEMIERAW
jgi:alcohol dehydrogenase class IV